MRIGYAVMSAIVQQKLTFLFFVIFIVKGIYCQSHINNIENGNRVFCRLLSTMG